MGGGSRRVWPEPSGTPGSQASALTWATAPEPLYPVLGELRGRRVRAGAGLPRCWAVPRPSSRVELGAPNTLKGSPCFPGTGVRGEQSWQASCEGRNVLGGVTGEPGVRGGHWHTPGACHQHKLNTFGAGALGGIGLGSLPLPRAVQAGPGRLGRVCLALPPPALRPTPPG